MGAIRKILVATDFSEGSAAATRYAADLARKLGASITLFHAYFAPVPVPFPDGSAYIPTPEVLAEMESYARQQLRLLRDTLPDLTVEIMTAEGSPREVIRAWPPPSTSTASSWARTAAPASPT